MSERAVYAARVAALRQELSTKVPRAGALVITGDEDRRYLSGFRGDAGQLWISGSEQVLLTDSRFWEQAEQEAPDWRLVRVQKADLWTFLLELARAQSVTALAFDPGAVPYATYRNWRRHLTGVSLLPAPGLVSRLRMVKDAGELAAITAAAAITDTAFAQWLPLVQPGVSEAELALEMEYRLRRAGAEAVGFPPIIAAGPRGALAHAIPGPAILQPGQLLVVDIGARVDGYHSDMTRTVAVPGADPGADAREVFAIVQAAMAAGVAAVRAGAGCQAVDAAARDVITAAGYGEVFGHGTGHGVGLAIHEGPSLSARADPKATIPAGAVVTIEPGIYLPGRFGIRLEQLVAVGPDGGEVLSRSPIGL